MTSKRFASSIAIFVALAVVAGVLPAFAQSRSVADVGQVLIPSVALGVAVITKDGDGIGGLSKSLAVAMATTHILKATIDAERPNGGKHSFPSGHTTAAFTGASFLWRRYGWKAGLPAIAGATLVASSRVDTRDHHLRDVIAGAGIGMASAMIFTDRRVSVAPIIARGGGGVMVSVGN